MSFDAKEFNRTLAYTASAPIPKVLVDLNEISNLDAIATAKKKKFTGLLIGFIIGIFISFFLIGIYIGIFTLIGCVIGAVITGVLYQRYARLDVEEYRYDVPRQLLEILGRDMERAASIQLKIAFSSPFEAAKKVSTGPHPRRSGWKIDYFNDPWLEIQGALLDGTDFTVAVTTFGIAQYGWKRGRSGKQKFKRKTKIKSVELAVELDISKRKYGAISVLAEQAADAIKLPPAARMKRLKISDDAILLVVKLHPQDPLSQQIKTEELQPAIVMMLMSLYQILNLAKKLSRTIEA